MDRNTNINREYKKFGKNIFVMGVFQIFEKLKGLILIPILTKIVGVSNYGVYVQIMVIIGLTIGISLLGLPQSLSRFLPSQVNRDKKAEMFYTILSCVFVAGILILSLFYFSSYKLSAWLNITRQTVLIIGLLILVKSLFQITVECFRAMERMGMYATLLALVTCAELIAVASAAYYTSSIERILQAMLIVNVPLFLIALGVVIKEIGWKMPKFKGIKRYLSFSLPLLPNHLMHWIIESSDRILIGIFLGSFFVGIYNPGYALGSLIFIFTTIIGTVLPPTASRLYDNKNNSVLQNLLNYSYKYFLILTVPFFFASIILSRPILKIFSTSEIANQGYFIVPIIALSFILLGCSRILIEVIKLRKETLVMTKIWLIAGVLNFAINIILIKVIGILAAALSTLVAYLAMLLVTYNYSLKYFKFDMYIGVIVKSTFAAILMMIPIYFMSPTSVVDIIFFILIGAFIYFLLIVLLKIFDEKEIKMFKKILLRVEMK